MSTSIKEVSEQLGQCVAKHSADKFTGELVFHLHLRDGGVGKINYETKGTLPRPLMPSGPRKGSYLTNETQ